MASRNCLYYSPFKWNPWSVNIMTLCDFISIWVSPPPSFSCIFILRTKHFSSRKKSIGDMVHRWLLKTAYTILLSNETLDQSISCLCDDFLASEWAFPPSFSCIFIFRTIHFSSRKKSIGDMVHIWILETAYTIVLSKETLDLSISYLCKILLASEWALPPLFSCIFMFRTKHFLS